MDNAAIIALGDQIQQTVIDSSLPVIGFVVIFRNGTAEYRSPLPLEVFQPIVIKVAEAL